MQSLRLLARSTIPVLLLLAPGAAAPQEPDRYLYRTEMIRAAPGELAAVIEAIQGRMPVWQEMYPEGPFWMRHSQGDHWDLLLLFPMGEDFGDYFGSAALQRQTAAASASGTSEAEFRQSLLPRIAWQEELYVWGPPSGVVAERFTGSGYFHVEVFLALPGKRHELIEQRRMENRYLTGIDRPTNLIFSRAGGAAWDCYTLGFYRDLKHFAGSADVPAELEEQAAKAAGFSSSSTIGTYLRELIGRHQDTLAVAVR